MSTETAPTHKTRVITLTDRAPVRIREDEWPIVASAYRHDGKVECQANQTWHLTVRQHADGRFIVYGIKDSGPGGTPAGFEPIRAGELHKPEHLIGIAIVIHSVGGHIGCSSAMIDECIADLPPVDL